jgi:hypothetical protein
LDEIRNKLFFGHGESVPLAMISWTLSRMRISKKSLSRRAAEGNGWLRTLWKLETAKLDDPHHFVFIDESAVDNKTVQHCTTYWGDLGKP